MTEAVIVSTARTPIGKAFRGAFNMTHGATLGGHVVKHAVERAKIDPAEVDDVVLGCATPEKATGSNIARLAAIRAGMPVTAGISPLEWRGADVRTASEGGVPCRSTSRNSVVTQCRRSRSSLPRSFCNPSQAARVSTIVGTTGKPASAVS